ncbi:Transcription elongation factor B polypeptide 2 [Chlorella sorokiniana]|uniref:Transcription elongation factor B polypeptide 2 n=1 Tax=Chlorella sorokiniana TaxID=3076 RepID=A0A2P6TBY2_CHLSO|nr:Transcription elongation factor B polypeptide 2 [Chlorella sorokiniana]|eukprot:PRW18390.1 Transcription elongation factor B polypeptide 2 [Chlorella sorokiniana]
MLKQKLQELLQKPTEEQRLYRGEALLEDGQSLAELGVQNDDELGVAYRLPDGEFEALHVERFDQGSKEDAPAG